MNETLNMRVGSNIGVIMLDIAQNNIQKGNIEYGINVYNEGFGIPQDYAMMLLKNKLVMVVDEDGTGVNLVDDEEEIANNLQNIYDWKLIIDGKLNSLNSLYKSLVKTKEDFEKLYNGNIEDYSILDMMGRYFSSEELKNIGLHNIAARIIGAEDCKLHNNQYDNPQQKWDQFEDKFHGYEDIVESDTTKWKKILFLTVKYNKLIRHLHKEYIGFENLYFFLTENEFITNISKIENTLEKMISILCKFADDSKGYYHPLCNTSLYEYKNKLYEDILSTRIGKEYCRNGIVQKNIMDGYDAGWLSPDGEFYGADGETSSMIHMYLAEDIFNGNNKYSVRMQNDGVSTWGGSNSPDYWLEKHGWIKIHHNDCYGSFIGHRNEPPTPDYPYAYNPTNIQIQMICDYADKFYNGKFYTEANAFGRTRHTEPHSTYKVRQMDDLMIHQIFRL